LQGWAGSPRSKLPLPDELDLWELPLCVPKNKIK
jgi:NADH:ubiquinone oxidoreductase subunit F (NADH-binding)